MTQPIQTAQRGPINDILNDFGRVLDQFGAVTPYEMRTEIMPRLRHARGRERLSIVRGYRHRRFNTRQVDRILGTFRREDMKLSALRALGNTITDRYNADQLLSHFTYGPSRREARLILGLGGGNRRPGGRYPRYPRYPRDPGRIPSPSYPRPRPGGDFQRLLSDVRRESFDSGKLSIIRSVARTRSFSAEQVRSLLDQFSFDDNRLDALRNLAPSITDTYNNYRILGAFTFDSNKREAERILRGYRLGSLDQGERRYMLGHVDRVATLPSTGVQIGVSLRR